MDIKDDLDINFAQDSFSSAPEGFEGDVILCPICRQGHRLVTTTVTYVGDNGEEEKDVRATLKPDVVLFYRCKSASYLGAACNHLVDNVSLAPAGTPVI